MSGKTDGNDQTQPRTALDQLLSPASVLFMDVVGSTKLFQKRGNEVADGLIKTLLKRAFDVIDRLGGHTIKTIGDCVMAALPDPHAAARVAIDLQLTTRLPLDSAGTCLLVRIGFCHGPVITRDNDVFGDAVNIAARLCDLAKSEQILTTQDTAKLIGAELQSSVRHFDHAQLKGVQQPVPVVQLMWDQRHHTEMISVTPDIAFAASELDLVFAGRHELLKPPDVPITIGRGEDCSIVVDERLASRHHLRIEYRRGKFTLIDESSNGTYVVMEQPEGEKSVYVRNEPLTLIGKGRFALGVQPDQATVPFRFGIR